MKEGKLVLSAHSQGGKRAETAKGIFKELQNTAVMMLTQRRQFGIIMSLIGSLEKYLQI